MININKPNTKIEEKKPKYSEIKKTVMVCEADKNSQACKEALKRLNIEDE